MRQTTCRQTSLPLAPQYQGTDYTEDIEASSWHHAFRFARRQVVSACSGSPPQCSTFSSTRYTHTQMRPRAETRGIHKQTSLQESPVGAETAVIQYPAGAQPFLSRSACLLRALTSSLERFLCLHCSSTSIIHQAGKGTT